MIEKTTRNLFWGVIFICFCVALIIGWDRYWRYVTRASTVTAAEAGDLVTIMKLRAEGMSLNYRDSRKFMWTPLIASIRAGETNVVYYLLTNGVDVNLSDGEGQTPLMYAIESSATSDPQDDTTIIEQLIAHGANPSNGPGLANAFTWAKISPYEDKIVSALKKYQTNSNSNLR